MISNLMQLRQLENNNKIKGEQAKMKSNTWLKAAQRIPADLDEERCL